MPQFQSGQSGNPKGRPKKEEALTYMVREALSQEKDGISHKRALIELALKKALRGDRFYFTWLFDRGYGRALERIAQVEDDEEFTLTYGKKTEESNEPELTGELPTPEPTEDLG